MSDLKLTTTIDAENPVLHDLEVVAGQIQWVGMNIYDADEQAEMIVQRVNCRLLFIKGEWYLDQNKGNPWHALVAKGTTAARMERIFGNVIGGTPGIAAVTRVTVTKNNTTRVATVTWSASADAGAQIGPVALDTPFVVRET